MFKKGGLQSLHCNLTVVRCLAPDIAASAFHFSQFPRCKEPHYSAKTMKKKQKIVSPTPLGKAKGAKGGQKTYGMEFEVVKLKDLQAFKERCDVQFAKLGIAKTTSAVPIFGSRPLDDETTRPGYLGKLRCFISFLLASGRWDESLLIFHPYCPVGVIACQSEAIVEFIYVAFAPKKSQALDRLKKTIVNAEGEPILKCASFGEWGCNENMHQLSTALSHVHENAHGMTTEYVEKCEDCFREY